MSADATARISFRNKPCLHGHSSASTRYSGQGPGIRSKEKLFQPFYTTKPSGGGLALAIARNIVRAHSGRIRAHNRAEGGACFEIWLSASHVENQGNISKTAAGIGLARVALHKKIRQHTIE